MRVSNSDYRFEAANSDPRGFLSGLEGLTVIDEVQKAPALLPAIKVLVDRDRRPGRFLLTGSANVLTLPRVSESLAGRMQLGDRFHRGILLSRSESCLSFGPKLFTRPVHSLWTLEAVPNDDR